MYHVKWQPVLCVCMWGVGGIKIVFYDLCWGWLWIWCSQDMWKGPVNKDVQGSEGWVMWSQVEGETPQRGQTTTRRVGICSSQVGAWSAVAELTRWGSQNPTTPVFRWDYLKKKYRHNNQKPTPLSLSWYGHWKMPLGHSQQICVQVIFDTFWKWSCAKRLINSDWTERLSFQGKMKIGWTRMTTQGSSYAPETSD